MPISNFPFTCLQQGTIPRPMLPVCIVNPHTGKGFRTWALVDTGADECALPAMYAQTLGHTLDAGSTKQISTGNGETVAYAHTTRVDIYALDGGGNVGQCVYSIPDTPIDFMPNLHCVLLGVRNFLANFKLCIDYPSNIFSINK